MGYSESNREHRDRLRAVFLFELAGFLRAVGLAHSFGPWMCQSGANVMTDQCYFETTSIERQGDHRARERAILTKCQLREESRKQRQIVADQREEDTTQRIA